MSRPVFIAASGLLCARGDSPGAVSEALWAGECSAGSYTLGERSFPYFALPLTETDWLLRAEHAIRQVSAQLGPLGPETPLFVASSSFQIGYFEQQGAPFAMPIGSASFSRTNRRMDGFAGRAPQLFQCLRFRLLRPRRCAHADGCGMD